MPITKDRIKSPNEVDNEYMCPICNHLLWKPVECQTCEQTYCKQCVDKCLTEKPGKSPLCQDHREKACSLKFYTLLCKFKIECENKANGCNEILPYELLEKHQVEQCQYHLKQCSGCQKKIIKKDFEPHQQSCDEVQIECTRCKLVYRKKENHSQINCIMNELDQSNKKIQLLEKTVENLQLNIQKLEINASLFVPLLFTPGIIHDVSLALLTSSWTIIYDFPYSHKTTVEQLRGLRSKCKDQIIVGAIKGRLSIILTIAAMGPSDILLLNSQVNRPTTYGNVNWYLTSGKAFGFAPITTVISCNSADTGESDNSENRLSWHLNGQGGFRAGASKSLDDNNEWRKIILTQR